MKILSFLALFIFSIQAQSQVFTEYIKAVALDREAGDRFGFSVSISGNYAIIGAYGDDFGLVDNNRGAAYIYEKTGIADWTFVQKIISLDQADYDRFGWSVAINGNIAVVGAYAEDDDEFGLNYLSRAGSAYVFERNISGVWNQVKKLVPTDRDANDQFGWSVSVSGQTILVGANYESHDADGANYLYQSGSAYLFDRLIDGTWIETQKIVASDRSEDIIDPDGGGGGDVSDQFGHTVRISGEYLVVGAPNHDYDIYGASPLSEAGAAYIFERSGGIWSEVSKLQNSDRAAGDRFGCAVGIDGDAIIVGAFREDENEFGTGTVANAGSAYIFERSIAGIWTHVKKIVAPDRKPGDRFGFDVSISGSSIVVGSLENDLNEIGEDLRSNAGAAYIYKRNEGSDVWEYLEKIVASDRDATNLFGNSVSISGPSILVGAHQQGQNVSGDAFLKDAGAAYFYSEDVCIPSSSEQTLTLCAGKSVLVGGLYKHSTSGIYIDIIPSVVGCDSTVTTNLTITAAPTSSQSASTCYGYPFKVGSSYYHESGIYTDTLKSHTGCDSLIITNLTVEPKNSVEQDIVICWGESYTIGASTYSEEGIYHDIITSSTLCDSIITTKLTIQLPVNNAISQVLNKLMANLNDGSYQWVKCDPFEILIGATEQTYFAPEFGTYAVIMTDGACVDTSACVYVSVLNIDAQEAHEYLNIFPNPSNGSFQIAFKNTLADYEGIEILNELGQVVYSDKNPTFINSITLNNPKPGIYVLRLFSKQKTIHKQFVIF